jgi:hypothetical protein
MKGIRKTLYYQLLLPLSTPFRLDARVMLNAGMVIMVKFNIPRKMIER